MVPDTTIGVVPVRGASAMLFVDVTVIPVPAVSGARATLFDDVTVMPVPAVRMAVVRYTEL